MKKKCIYLHKNIDKDEIFYVGIGNYDRPYNFRNRGKFWHNYTNKYPNFSVIIIQDNLTIEEAIELEIYYISIIGRRDLGNGTLINLTDGGDGVNNPSDSTRLKMSEAQSKRNHTEESKIKISNWGKGKTWIEMYGEETALKMKDSRKVNKIRECLICKFIKNIYCKDMCVNCYNNDRYSKNNATPIYKRRNCKKRWEKEEKEKEG